MVPLTILLPLAHPSSRRATREPPPRQAIPHVFKKVFLSMMA
jgi:hypothetical protein